MIPISVLITEEGPREGFQIEKGAIQTEGKVALIECATLAECVVGHPLPGSIKQGGSLARLRAAVREGASA